MQAEKKPPCACQGANLGKFTQPIILSIVKQGGVTGYRIIKQMQGYAMFCGSNPDPTGIYRYLKSMEEKNLILNVSQTEDSCYEITDHGLWCLENWKKTISQYTASLQQLLQEL